MQSPGGTIYFGDGNWGVFEETCSPQNQADKQSWAFAFDMEVYGSSFHVWLMQFDLLNGNVTYKALNVANQVYNQSIASQKLSSYT